MPITLNHTIVPAHDKEACARFLQIFSDSNTKVQPAILHQ